MKIIRDYVRRFIDKIYKYNLKADDGHVKLADFGLSKEGIADDALTRSFCGSPAYLSPEMLKNKGSGKASDIYGLGEKKINLTFYLDWGFAIKKNNYLYAIFYIGAVLYEMLVGNPPYYSDDIPTMYKAIEEGKLSFPKYVSEEARNIISVIKEFLY